MFDHACYPVFGMIGHEPELFHCRDCDSPLDLTQDAWFNWLVTRIQSTGA